MKRALLSAAILALLSVDSFGQTEAVTVENPNAPEISFETETIDYGNIEVGSDRIREFKFKNTGKSPLIIQNARGSCGCTVRLIVELPKGENGTRYELNSPTQSINLSPPVLPMRTSMPAPPYARSS